MTRPDDDAFDDAFDDALALANPPGRPGAGPDAGGRGSGPRRAQGRGKGSGTGRETATDVAWDAARAAAYRAVRPLPARRLPLEQALGHTLAEPLAALTDLPAFDTSAMDGWAVAGPGPWRLTGPGAGLPAVLAGSPELPPLADGQAVAIATGARIPPGTTAVLRTERGETAGQAPGQAAREAAEGLLRGPNPPPGADIRPRGQECRSGTPLLPAGTPLTPAALGLAAAAGYDELAVRPRPRAEILVLGGELLHRGLPRDGLIRDALGPMAGPWLAALGADVLVTRRLGDDAEALHEAVATSRADLVVTTGSTAAGPVDHLRGILRRRGARLLIHGVAVRPGHPMVLARLPGSGGAPLVGLPGNPLAAVSALLTLAAPLLCALAGRAEPALTTGTRLTTAVRGHPRDTRLVPVALPEPGQARPVSYAGPAMLRGIASADALAVIPPGGALTGDPVRLLPLPSA